MVARLKMKGLGGKGYHQEFSLRLKWTQHGTSHQVQTWQGLTDRWLFLDSMGGGAWLFSVGGLTSLADSVNERDFGFAEWCLV